VPQTYRRTNQYAYTIVTNLCTLVTIWQETVTYSRFMYLIGTFSINQTPSFDKKKGSQITVVSAPLTKIFTKI